VLCCPQLYIENENEIEDGGDAKRESRNILALFAFEINSEP
jgi:hypothetical protein